MKEYLRILAYYTAILIVSSLVGTGLALYVLARLPWMVTASMMLLIVCVIAWLDYRRVTTSRAQHKDN